MLSQSQSLCLSDAIDLLTELSSTLEQSDTGTFSLPRVSRRETVDGTDTGPTSPEYWEAPATSAERQERDSLIKSLTHVKSLLQEEREKQKKNEAQHLKINQQLASALSSTSLHVDSLKKQLHQSKSSKATDANAITDYNSSGSERENMNREIKLLTEARSRLQEEVSCLEKKIGSIREAGKRYDGLKQDDLKMNLGAFDLEINKLREEVNLLKSEKKKLKTDKQDLVGTLKQLYSALDEKEGETSTLIKSYDRRLTEKDELLTSSMNEKRALENDHGRLATQSLEQADTARKMRDEMTQLQKRLLETESDMTRTRRARSPTDSSCGNKSQHSYGHASSHHLASHSYSNMHQGSAGGSEVSSASEYAKPNKNYQYRAPDLSELSRKQNEKPHSFSGVERENKPTETPPQYATVGPPSRQRDKKYYSYTDSSMSKSLDRDLNNPPIPTPQASYSNYRMSERRSSSAHLNSSKSLDTMSPAPASRQNTGNAVREEPQLTRARSRSMTTSGQDKERNNGNIFSNSLSRIFSRNRRKKPANADRHASLQGPTYSNLPPDVSNRGKHQLLDTNRGGIAPKREAPLPPPPPPISPKLQTSCSSLTKTIFGSEERKIGLLEETRKVHISRWNQITVLAWMDVRLGMTKYLNFAQHVIQSGQTLLELSERDYEEQLGIANPVHKRKLQLAIEDCRRPQNNQHPNIHEIDHYWVAQIWLPKVGLSRYSKLFYSNLVDGRVLRSLQKREADELLKIAPRIDQLSLTSAVQLLRRFNFSRDLWLESLNTEPVCWDNERIHTWLQSIDLMEYADQVLDSGVHGALVCLESSFTYETLAYIMNIPQERIDHRKSLRRQLEALTNSFKGFQSPGVHETSLTRSYSVPRSYTTPRHNYVADKQHTANSYSRAFTHGSTASITRNLSLSFNSSSQSLSRKRLESTPV